MGGRLGTTASPTPPKLAPFGYSISILEGLLAALPPAGTPVATNLRRLSLERGRNASIISAPDKSRQVYLRDLGFDYTLIIAPFTRVIPLLRATMSALCLAYTGQGSDQLWSRFRRVNNGERVCESA